MPEPPYPNAQQDDWQTAPLPRVSEPKRTATVTHLWQGLGLVAIAVVSGVLWYSLNAGSADSAGQREQTGTASEGEFAFRSVHGPVRDSDCAGNAYGDAADFFATHPCDQLARTLYASVPANGREVLTSVAVVRMPNETRASELRMLLDTDDTGNVEDLVRAGISLPGAPEDLAGGGYASTRRGTVVVIVESDYRGQSAGADQRLLQRVSKDALRLGAS